MRCEAIGGRRGEVMFVGEIPKLTEKANGPTNNANGQQAVPDPKAPKFAKEESKEEAAEEPVKSVVAKHVTIEDEATEDESERAKEAPVEFIQLWIGVRYDEPVGKVQFYFNLCIFCWFIPQYVFKQNEGTIFGKKYFEAPANHGAFIKPEMLKVGVR